MVRLISSQRGGLAALKLTKLFGIDDFPAAKDSGKVLIIIIYCYLIIIIIIIISEKTAKVKQAPVESLQEAKKEHRELASNLPCSSLLTGSSSLAASAVTGCKRFSHSPCFEIYTKTEV